MPSTENALGRHELLRELAKNDTGAVYKAIRRDNQNTVAVRTICPRPESNLDTQIILQNANRALSLKSPNVVLVHEVYEYEGIVCLEMDYAEGILLSSALASLSEWEIIDVTRQVCAAIDHAYSQKLSHMNLHPANIVQEWDGTVKLLDYGVTVDAIQRANANSSIPQSLYYLSPEQASGEQPDWISNLFSWATVLYEIVAGKKPFTGESAGTLLEQIREHDPAPPHSVKRSVPLGVSSVIMKALSKVPQERFQTGAEFTHALEHSRDEVAPLSKIPIVVGVSTLGPSNKIERPDAKVERPNAKGPLPAGPNQIQAAPPIKPLEPVRIALKPVSQAVTPAPTQSLPPKSMQASDATVRPSADRECRPAIQTVSVEPTPAAEFLVVQSRVPASPAVPSVRKPLKPSSGKVSLPAALRGLRIPSGAVLLYIAGGLGLAVVALCVGLFVYSRHKQQVESQSTTIAETVPAASTPDQVTPAAEPDVPEQTAAADAAVTLRKKKQKKTPAPAIAPLPVTGGLSIESTPQGASIEIDGQSTQFLTPHVLAALAAGSHTMRLLRPGFEPEARTIHVQAGQTLAVVVPLSELRATVAINSDPPGARIIIDGKDTARTTPARVMLLKGKYNIALQKQGFLQFSNSVDAIPGQSYNVSPRLSPMGNAEAIREIGKLKKLFGRGDAANMGKVQFRTTPKGAQIAVNGRVLKNVTPTEFNFPAGNYEIVITLPGYKQVERTIAVLAGPTITVDVKLEQ